MSYLVGSSRADPSVAAHLQQNVHAEPHLVAGDAAIMAWFGEDELSLESARQIARRLDDPRLTFGTRVLVPKKDEHGVKVGEKDAHVWHCSLSLAATEGVQSDELWARVTEDFVAEMGFTDEPSLERAGCRWVAVRHGQSADGNDHVHVVVNLVREDGSKADVWRDRSRAQAACNALEKRHGLVVLESRESGIGARGHKPAELAIAARRGAPEVARETLARQVRACAAAAGSEAEFVRRLRLAGVKVKPRYVSGRDDVVAGYSVAERPRPGEAVAWFGGGRLARDLTLPRLRESWSDTPTSASEAAAEWNAARRGQQPVAPGPESAALDAETQQKIAADLGRLRQQMREVPVGDRAAWARVAKETAGAFAAWSMSTEPVPGPLAATADVLARSSQLRAHQVAGGRASRPAANAAARVFAAGATEGTKANAAVIQQLGKTVAAMLAAHRAAGDAQRAAEISTVVREQLRDLPAAAPMFPGTQRVQHQRAGAAVAERGDSPDLSATDERAREVARKALSPREPGNPLPPPRTPNAVPPARRVTPGPNEGFER